MSLQKLHIQLIAFSLVLALGSVSITPSRPVSSRGIRHLSTIQDGSGSHNQVEQIGLKFRRYEIPQNKFLVIFEVLLSEKPLPDSIYLRSIFSYDVSSLPTTARYYYPPPRDLPLTPFHA
jgi:hypothetical protein